MRSFVDLDRTFGAQPVRLGARLARLDLGRGGEDPPMLTLRMLTTMITTSIVCGHR